MFRPLGLAGLLGLGSLCALEAAPPSLKHLYPIAGAVGAKTSITALGTFAPWPVEVWVDAPGIKFTPGDKAGKFEIEVAADAPLGPHLVRMFNSTGASEPRFFIVAPQPDLAEAEPNDSHLSPQSIATVPSVVCGRLEKSGDVDSFAVTLKKGQPLTAWLEGYVLASPFDGMIRILDRRGAQLAFNHDGHTLDPVLSWAAPDDGTYIVQIMGFVYPATADVRFTGSDQCIYRLHLEPGPGRPPLADATGTPEQEPNDTAEKAVVLAIPSTLLAHIDRPLDEDRYAVTVKKGQAYEFTVTAASAGSPLDGWLKIESKEGKELARNDDAQGSRDPSLIWTAPADGNYVIAVGDVAHHGGPAYAYRLEAREFVPSATATVAKSSVVLDHGKTVSVDITVKRSAGSKSPLELVATDLPDGVTAAKVAVPAKGESVALKLQATAEVSAANQPIHLSLRDTVTNEEKPVRFFLTTSGENNGVPQGFSELVVDSLDTLWLTVTAAPPPPPPKATPTPPSAATPALASPPTTPKPASPTPAPKPAATPAPPAK